MLEKEVEFDREEEEAGQNDDEDGDRDGEEEIYRDEEEVTKMNKRRLKDKNGEEEAGPRWMIMSR